MKWFLGFTALHYAAVYQNMEILEFLARDGFLLDAKDNKGKNVLIIIATHLFWRDLYFFFKLKGARSKLWIIVPEHNIQYSAVQKILNWKEMIFPVPRVENDWLRYNVTILPRGTGNIISSHLKMFKCYSHRNDEISTGNFQ